MSAVFRISDLGLLTYYLGLLTYYLGIEVNQSVDGISLTQGCYAKKILEKGGLLDYPCLVPMQPKLKLRKESESAKVDATKYRSLVGSLRYLVNTRPNLAFSVGYVSMYMEESHEDHLAAVKHILRYIAGTIDYGVFYPRRKGDKVELHGYSDSDLAGDLDSRKNTSGVLFFLGRSPISWQSTKQRVVALSSCEAEYIVAATACNTLIFRKNKICQANAFHLNSNRKISNNLIGCISWHEYFYFLALGRFRFSKRFKFYFEIFS
jgi:hypothetical protein